MFFLKQSRPLDRKLSLQFRIETFIVKNPMKALTLSILIGSSITALLIVLLYISFAPATIGGIV